MHRTTLSHDVYLFVSLLVPYSLAHRSWLLQMMKVTIIVLLAIIGIATAIPAGFTSWFDSDTCPDGTHLPLLAPPIPSNTTML